MTTHYTVDGKKVSLLCYGAMRLATVDGKHANRWVGAGYSDSAIDQELLNRQIRMLLDGGLPTSTRRPRTVAASPKRPLARP